MAKYYRAVATEHESEAKNFETLIKHGAEHSRDFAEALRDVAEVHDGIAEGPVK